MNEPYRYPSPEPPHAGFSVDDYEPFRGTLEPIVIDNGSSTLRFGFASAQEPTAQQNIVSRYKDRRIPGTVLLYGDAVDIEATTRTQSRTPWEGDLLLNFDALESALDYVFIKLGIDTASVEHPVAITERICSPLHSRALTSQLLFELYNVPAACYPIDALMSFRHNSPQPEDHDGLVLSFNTHSTSIIPVLDGRGILSQAKRMPWGAAQASEYLLRLIQLKHPTLPMRLNTQHSTWMMQNFCEFAPDYRELLRSLDDPVAIQNADRVVQMPYAATQEVEKTEEEIARATEKRRETGKRLQEQLAKKRAEQLAEKEQDLEHLQDVRSKKPTMKKTEWANLLRKEGLDDDDELEEAISNLETAISKAKRKAAADLAAAAATADDKDEPNNAMNEEPTFPLLDTPDADLDEEGLKEKKKQKLLKAGYEARMRAKAEKERVKKEAEEAQKREDEERDRDLEGWCARVRGEHDALILKLRERKRRRAALNDRKSAAAQARMKSIASLAADAGPSRKRRKVNGEDKDTFGANDDDWAIYRKINTGAPSDDEEDDEIALLALEAKLLAHDPSLTAAHTHAAQAAARGALVAAVRPPDADARGHVHLSLERWRAPETWWSPSMAGADVAGLGELLQSVLHAFPVEQRARLARRVFFTGSPAQLPGLDERLRRTLRPILPPEMGLNVVKAYDPVLDAWRGMASFAASEEFKTACVTKEEYEEYGGERIKKWWGGNWNGAV